MATPLPVEPHLPSEPSAWRPVLIGLRCLQASLLGFTGPFCLILVLAFRGPGLYFDAPLLPFRTASLTLVAVYAVLIGIFAVGLALQGRAPVDFEGRRYAHAALAMTAAGSLLVAFFFLMVRFPLLTEHIDHVVPLRLFHILFVVTLTLSWLLAGAMALWFLRALGARRGHPVLARGAAGCTKWLAVWAATVLAAGGLPTGPAAATHALMLVYGIWLIGLAPVVFVWWQVLLVEAAHSLKPTSPLTPP